MANTIANKLKYLLAVGAIDFSTDIFKIILMDTGFVFDKDTHHGYADVSGEELPTGNGYTAGAKTLTGVTLTEDDVDDRTEIRWANVTWTASGGSIGPTPGAIIFDDTVTTPTADPVISYIDFGGEQTQADGGTCTISNIEIRIS